MKRTITISVLVLGAVFLAGCGFTPQGTFARKAITQGGAQAMDEGLNNAEWFICQAASIGSVRRHYGRTGMAEHYRALCDQTAVDLIISPK